MKDQNQIEKMAKDICHAPTCKIKKNGGACYNNCKAFIYAFRAVNAGYRKQCEGEWIVTYADSGSFGEYAPFIEFKCPKCESGYGFESGQYGWEYGEPIPWVACPLCGAKMKG